IWEGDLRVLAGQDRSTETFVEQIVHFLFMDGGENQWPEWVYQCIHVGIGILVLGTFFLIPPRGSKNPPWEILKFAAFGFLVPLAAIKGLWESAVPELFPKAVDQELIAATISWGLAFRIAAAIALFATLLRFCVRAPEKTDPAIQALNDRLDALSKQLGTDSK